MTPQEVKLWVRLRQLREQGHHFRRQVPRGPHVLDFACLKSRLIVEVDGAQHGFDAGLARDAQAPPAPRVSGLSHAAFLEQRD
jgi:very-short-patch-repair endonuclease